MPLHWIVLLVGWDAEAAVSIERDVPVKMRDGVVLRADVHRPAAGGPYPVLVLRTPYGKQTRRFERFVQAGYIVVCQDARGRYASDGTYESLVRFETHDGPDGYDTVEWAARLPGSTGKVGTMGVSYNAFLQWRLAPLRPPSLVAMSAHSIPGRHTDVEGPGTIRPGRRLAWWVTTISPDLRRRSNGPEPHTSAQARKLWDQDGGKRWLHHLPWLTLPREAFEGEAEAVFFWLRNPHTDPWKLHEGCKEITVPNLNVVGWYDHCNGDMLLDRTMFAQAATETARKGSRTLIGPWGHSTLGARKIGSFDFGPEAGVDLVELEIRWFDRWLKGRSTGIDSMSPVRIFVMGDDRWRDEPAWPVERATARTFYLTSGGNANTPQGDGKLIEEPAERPAQDGYAYDPRDPVPSLHGPALFTVVSDQRPLAHRKDILVYQTDPLEDRIEVTGNPSVELCAASSAPDTDFFARLVDVAPDGTARDVSLGMVRARYRDGLDRPALIEPGALVRYQIRMSATSNAFLPGHRIRLDVTSSDFPNYDRNHNTAADQNADAALQSAEQTVFHGAERASRLVVPWVP